MDDKISGISRKTTLKVIFITLIGVWMTNFLYSFVLPQVLIMEKIERNEFYLRTFLLTIVIGSIAVFLVYLFYRKVEKAIKKVEKGQNLSEKEIIKVEKSFKRIELFLFLIGALSYLFAVIINISLELIKTGKIDLKYWIFRTILALSFGILNGIVIARLINYAWIDAKNALNIRYLKNEKNNLKTTPKLIVPSILILFVNISFLVIAAFNFFERYAFTFIKFNFILKYFLSIAFRFLLVDLIIFYSIFFEHQKHIDHLYNQFDVMANQEIDLSKRVNIISFDEFGMMMSNINIILDKLQDSFIKVSNAEKIVSDLGNKIAENFLALRNENQILSKIINEIQNIEDNENKVIEKANEDFKNLIITIENSISKYKHQSDFVEKTSISMKNILSSFQFISRLMIETNQLFESLAANIFKGENEISKLNKINKKIIESNSQIQNITKLILDISERSSILAMNAAIESAHAGDVGAGFSVVAEEMRKLSDITSDSAQKIESIIKNVVESNSEIEEANILIEKLFSEIHVQLDDTKIKMEQVTKNSQEQTKYIDTSITEIEDLITINEQIKESTEKIVQIQPQVISSLNELQKITKSLLDANNIMIQSVEKMNESVEFTSSSFTKMIDAVSNLKEIISNYKIDLDISSDQMLTDDKKNLQIKDN